MKFKKGFIMLLLLVLCVGCASAISAADADIDNGVLNVEQTTDIDNDALSVDQSADVNSVGIDESNEEVVAASDDDAVLEQSNNNQKVSSIREDIENGGNIVLDKDLEIGSEYEIRNPTTIDGQGHTIDAQGKCRIFETFYDAPLTLKNLVLKNGKADQGGAIFARSKLTIENCKFINNKATQNGGAISIVKGSLTIKNSLFKKNQVTNGGKSGQGGAIWVHGVKSTITKTKFQSNSVISKSLKNYKKAKKYKFNGGAIFYYKSKHTLKDCTFTGNKATNQGGSIFSSKAKTVTVKNTQFKNNKAVYQDGGCLAITHGKLNANNCKFEKNFVKTAMPSCYGGAIWIHKGSSDIKKSTFKSNYVDSKSLKKHSKATKYKFSGGAVMLSAGTTHKLTDCKFTNNKASNHGGAIFVYKSNNVKINKCEFTKNRAKFEDGGAISFAGKKLTLTNSKFKNNLAYEDGGAMDSYSLNSKKIKITVKKCLFQANTGYKCGGAIWMGLKTNYNVVDTKFIKNKASSAGAVECEDGVSKFTKCTFKGNKAAKVTSWTVKTKHGGTLAHSGGAILVKNLCKVSKCKFSGNKAKWGNNIKVEGGRVVKS